MHEDIFFVYFFLLLTIIGFMILKMKVEPWKM